MAKEETSNQREGQKRVGRKRSIREKWRLTSLSNKVITGATVVIAFAGVLTFGAAVFQWLEMHGAGRQTEQLIEAANIQASAARKNARSARKMTRAASDQADYTQQIANQALAQVQEAHNLAKISRDTLEISQSPYITIGSKNGVVGEIRDSPDSNGWAHIVLHFQNTGHLPAKVCISYDGSAWPEMQNRFILRNPMARQQGKDSTGFGQIFESSCPTIGGDSEYDYLIKEPFKQDLWERIKKNSQSQIMVSPYVQYCDPFGRYRCKSIMLQFILDANVFQILGETDCSAMYGLVPSMPSGFFGTNTPLPPCAQPNEDWDYQTRFVQHSIEIFKQKNKN